MRITLTTGGVFSFIDVIKLEVSFFTLMLDIVVLIGQVGYKSNHLKAKHNAEHMNFYS